MAVRIIYPKGNQEIWLKTTSHLWASLPPSLKRSFSSSLDVLAGIRTEIANDAPVKWMPPIEVSADLWRIPGGKAHGQATTLHYDGDRYFGVRIPAQTALCEDRQLVRAILVHEFCHCFYNIEAGLAKAGIIEGPAERLPDFFNPFDSQEDERRMVDPFRWFGRSDAERFIYDGDSRVQGITENYGHLTKYLREIMPDILVAAGTISIPEEVVPLFKAVMAKGG